VAETNGFAGGSLDLCFWNLSLAGVWVESYMLVWFFLRRILLEQTAVIMSWRTTIGNHGIIELFTLFVTIHNFFSKGPMLAK
jgi:hypothetical protein